MLVEAPSQTRASRTAINRLVARGDRVVLWSQDLPPRGYDVIRPHHADAVRVGLDYLIGRYGHATYLDDRHDEIGQRFRLAVAGHTAANHTDAAADTDGDRPGGVEMVSPTSDSTTFDTVTALLDRPVPPRAVLTSSDAPALRVLEVAAQRGLAVPGDVAVLGLGDTDYGRTDGSARLTSLGELGGFDLVTELVADRLRPGPHEPLVHDVRWSVQRPGLTA